MVERPCSECGRPTRRRIVRPLCFCDNDCKGAWQRRAKPVSREWLHNAYVVEQKDCTQIATIVNRDPKSVWNWLKDFGIPRRKRGTDVRQHFPKGHTFRRGTTISEAHKEAVRLARRRDGRIPAFINGVHWTKALGRHGSNWKGGITPERQRVHSSDEWRVAVKTVWHRADAKCDRCGLDHRTIDRKKTRFHIHHIDSFAIRERRCDPDNLRLVCSPCHKWIHSAANTEGVFIGAGHHARKRMGAGQRGLVRVVADATA